MKSIMPLIVLALTPFPAAAQAYLPPAEMVDRALEAHPDLQAAFRMTDAADAERRSLAVGAHEWTVSADAMRRSIDNEGDFDEFQLNLSRRFRLPGKAGLDRRIGELGLDKARLEAQDMKHQTAVLLMELWTAWLGAYEASVADAEQLALFERDLAAVIRKVSSGDAPDIDGDLVRGALAEARMTAARSHGYARRMAAALAATFPELPLPQTPPLLEAPPPVSDSDAWTTRILERSHEIEIYDVTADHADAVARRSRTDLIADPEFGLRTFSERGGAESGAGVFVAIPIGGRARSAARSKALSLASAARLNAARARRDILSLATGDVITAQSEREAWAASKEALIQTNAAYSRFRRGYEIGANDLSNLLIAERRLIEARKQEADARLRACQAWLRLNIDAHELWLAESHK